jgi:hypothetical protein
VDFPCSSVESVPDFAVNLGSSILSWRRDLNKLATNVPSKWRMASITPDHAMIPMFARIRLDGIFGNDRGLEAVGPARSR